MLVMVGVGAWCGAGVLVAWVVVLTAAVAAAVVAVVAVTKAAAEMAVEAAMTVRPLQDLGSSTEKFAKDGQTRRAMQICQ